MFACQRIEAYFHSGASYFPENRPPMEARRLTVEDDLDGGDVVPGFYYPLQRLFA